MDKLIFLPLTVKKEGCMEDKNVSIQPTYRSMVPLSMVCLYIGIFSNHHLL